MDTWRHVWVYWCSITHHINISIFQLIIRSLLWGTFIWCWKEEFQQCSNSKLMHIEIFNKLPFWMPEATIRPVTFSTFSVMLSVRNSQLNSFSPDWLWPQYKHKHTLQTFTVFYVFDNRRSLGKGSLFSLQSYSKACENWELQAPEPKHQNRAEVKAKFIYQGEKESRGNTRSLCNAFVVFPDSSQTKGAKVLSSDKSQSSRQKVPFLDFAVG